MGGACCSRTNRGIESQCTYLQSLRKVDKCKDYARGMGVLAHLYRQLGIASRVDVRQVAGYLPLLVAWIYDHFNLARGVRNLEFQHSEPRLYKWRAQTVSGDAFAQILELRETLDDLKASDACMDCGFFYLVNHGVEEELIQRAFNESRNFFVLPVEEKMKLARKENRGYTPLYAENLDPSSKSKGDSKETFYVGPVEDDTCHLNQWPSKEVLPSWRSTMEMFHRKVLNAGLRLISLIALALDLDEEFFEKVGAVDRPMGFLRLLHYPVELGFSDEVVCGASAHSDYGMITLLVTDGVPGLQVCKEKLNQPRVWEDVHHINGAFVVNIGDLMERWTNCLFRSTLHRVMPMGHERYSMAFFLDPNSDCVVECLKSCCNESNPPRFPPIRSCDYLNERFRLTYSS